MDDILDVLQLGCAVKLDRFQAVRLGSYIKKLQAENEALTKLVSEKAMIHVSMNVAEIKAEAIESLLKDGFVKDYIAELAREIRKGGE